MPRNITPADLVKDGLLTETDFFIQAGAKDCDGKDLSLNQCLRIYGGMALRESNALMVEMAREGVRLDSMTASNIKEAMEQQWQIHNAFPGDVAQPAEPFTEGTLPRVVKNVMVRDHLEYRSLSAMQGLVARYEGHHLRETLTATGHEVSDDVFVELLRRERKQPVTVRRCQNPACQNIVTTTLEQAVMSIRRYGLLPAPGQPFANKFYSPHEKCAVCNRDRSWLKPVEGKFNRSGAHGGVKKAASLAHFSDALAKQRQREAAAQAAEAATTVVAEAAVSFVTATIDNQPKE